MGREVYINIPPARNDQLCCVLAVTMAPPLTTHTSTKLVDLLAAENVSLKYNSRIKKLAKTTKSDLDAKKYITKNNVWKLFASTIQKVSHFLKTYFLKK